MRMQIRRYRVCPAVIARHPISPVFLAISWNSVATQGDTESRTKSRSCRDASRDRNEHIRHKYPRNQGDPLWSGLPEAWEARAVLPVRCGRGGRFPPREKRILTIATYIMRRWCRHIVTTQCHNATNGKYSSKKSHVRSIAFRASDFTLHKTRLLLYFFPLDLFQI